MSDDGDSLPSDREAPTSMPDSPKVRDAKLCRILQWWLQSPHSLSYREPDGFVPVASVLAAEATIHSITEGDSDVLVHAVQKNTGGPIVCDSDGRRIGLHGLWAKICAVAEIHVAQSLGGILSAFEIMKQPAIKLLLEPLPDYDGRFRTLCEALKRSKFLHMQGVSASMHAPRASTQYENDAQPMDRAHRRHWQPKSVKEKISDAVRQLLQKATASESLDMDSHGAVSVSCLLEASEYLAEKCYKKHTFLLRCLSTSEQFHQVIVDDYRQTVRLASFAEQVCTLSEVYFAQLSWYENAAVQVAMPIHQLAMVPQIQRVLSLNSTIDLEGQLFNSLQSSELLEVWSASGGDTWVSRRAPTQVLCRAAEHLLDHHPKFVATRTREGVVPLSCIIEHSAMQKSLSRISPNMNEEDALDMLSAAIAHGSQRYELDGCGSRASVRERSPNKHPFSSPMTATTCPSDGMMESSSPAESASNCESGWVTPETQEYAFHSMSEFQTTFELINSGEMCCTAPLQLPAFLPAISQHHPFGMECNHAERPVPSQVFLLKEKFARDIRAARELLTFYFQPFNLQHNRLLLSALEHQCSPDSNRHRSRSRLPSISVDKLMELPRLLRVFERHRRNLASLLHAALEDNPNAESSGHLCVVPMPVRLKVIKGELYLELTYVPHLRSFVQYPLRASQSPQSEVLRSSLKALLDFEVGPHTSSASPPAHVFLVISLSVSSDLSNSNSPKARDLQSAVYEGALDPSILSWESRSKQLKRQLQYYGADIICLQGLQSIGFETHNSECESSSAWFCLNHEPDANHLVHLYRELNKLNYGVVFSPTLKIPQSQSRCLGNAVFWKKSRWKLESHFECEGTAVCVLLTSRTAGGPRILACCGKSAASYAKDWADDGMTDEELLLPLHKVARHIETQVDSLGAQPVLCGDFGCSPEAFEELSLGSLTSSYAAALGKECWTSASKYSSGQVTDYIFHGGDLKTLTVLGARNGPVDAVDLLKSGYPSDHLLLLAAIADCSALQKEQYDSRSEVWGTIANKDDVSFGYKVRSEAKGRGKSAAAYDPATTHSRNEVCSNTCKGDEDSCGSRSRSQAKGKGKSSPAYDLKTSHSKNEVCGKTLQKDEESCGYKGRSQGKGKGKSPPAAQCRHVPLPPGQGKSHSAIQCSHVPPPPGYESRPCPLCKRLV